MTMVQAGSNAAPAARSVPGFGHTALSAQLHCPLASGCRVELSGHRVPAGLGRAVQEEHKYCIVSVLGTKNMK